MNRLWPGVAFLAIWAAGCGQQYPTTSGGRTAAYWAEVLQQPDPDVELRRKAATKLGPLVPLDKAALPALLGALNDTDPPVRAHAAWSLGVYARAKAQEVLPVLRDALANDADEKVRQAAAKAVSRLSNPKQS